jgi:hypothetical protein
VKLVYGAPHARAIRRIRSGIDLFAATLLTMVCVGSLAKSQPAATPSSSPLLSAHPDDASLRDEVQAAVVIIEFNIADRAAGATGFITKYKGRKYVVTNLHVLRGEGMTEAEMIWSEGPLASDAISRQTHLARIKTSYQEFQKYLSVARLPKIQTLDGKTISAGTSLLLSASRDIALIPVETEIAPLEIDSEPPTRDQKVFVFGNAEAEHTLIFLDGTIKAVGPEKIELHMSGGELVPGMSGGPVVAATTGKVLGAISYKVEAVKNPEGKISVERIKIEGGPSITRVKADYQLKVRNFAFRMDNIADLQPITWAQFLLDCGTLHAMFERTRNTAIASAAPYSRFRENGQIEGFEIPPDFDSSIRMSYNSALRSFSSGIGGHDFEKTWKAYQDNLTSLLNQDLRNPKYRLVTPYLQNILRTELAAERQSVATDLRMSAGKVPSRNESN